MYMWTLCIHARPTPVRSFPEQNRTRQIEKLWTFYRLSYIRKRKKKKKDTKNYNPNPDERLKSEKGEKKKKKYFFYSLLRSWDLLLSKPKWIPGLTRTILEDSSEHLFSLGEGECDWAGAQGSRRQDRHTRSLPFAKPEARLPAQGLPPAIFAQVGRDGVAPCLGGLCSLCFFPASSEWKWQDHSRKAAKKMSVYFS